MISCLTSPLLAGTRHGFLGRTGGVSSGHYTSLNAGLGSGDDPALVAENRARGLEAVAPGARLVSCRQVHSAVALPAGDWTEEDRPEADALVTSRPGVALAILTADCAPVLLADREAGVIGAAHAGWKGALHGILEATLREMVRLGARAGRIAAVIGPCIARRSYEVGHEFRAAVCAEDPAHEAFFIMGAAGGRPHFDLEGFCVHRLAAAGVGRVDALGADTRNDPERFFSYRRATLANEPDYGRQMSLIAL